MIQIASPPPAAPQPAPPPPPEPELPVFNLPQRKEGADSILSEPDESDDEVFGSQPGGRVNTLQPLDLPPVPPPPEPDAPPSAPTSLNTSAPTAPLSASQIATSELPSPFTDLEPVSLPAAFAPAPVPAQAPAPAAPQPVAMPRAAPAPVPQPVHLAPVPAPQPVAPMSAAAGANPFSDFESPGPAPAAPRAPKDEPPDDEAPRKRKKRDRDDRDERTERDDRDDRDAKEDHKQKPARPIYSRDAAKAGAGGGVLMILLIAVGAYALLATGLAAYGLFFKSGEKLDTGHPLSTIPDNFGEFDPATRKKVTLYKFPVDGELPAAQRGALGEKIAVGQIEVQPVKIEKRRLEFTKEGAGGEKVQEWSRGPALVLTMMITNNSDMSIYPMDPAFTRRGDTRDKPITRLVVDKQNVFAGGPIPWPLNGPVKRQMEVQQKNDYVPLAPGESREYVVFTDARPDIINAVNSASGPMQWRVQVRRDPITYRGKEVPVTAVIGVDFKASEVRDQR